MEEAAVVSAVSAVEDSCSLENYLSQQDHTMDQRIAAPKE